MRGSADHGCGHDVERGEDVTDEYVDDPVSNALFSELFALIDTLDPNFDRTYDMGDGETFEHTHREYLGAPWLWAWC